MIFGTISKTQPMEKHGANCAVMTSAAKAVAPARFGSTWRISILTQLRLHHKKGMQLKYKR